MILTAGSDGIASNWACFFGLEAVEEMLAIPGEVSLRAIVAFGYDDRSRAMGEKDRKPFSDVVSHGSIGRPMEQ